MKVSKVHNRYLAHWGTDLSRKSENNLVFLGLLWFERNVRWWAAPCLSSSSVQRGGALPAAFARPSHLQQAAREWQGNTRLTEFITASHQPAKLRKTQPLWHWVFPHSGFFKVLFPEENLGQDTECIICFSPTGQDGLNSLTLIRRRHKESMVPPSFPLHRVACWLSPTVFLCNRN